MQSGEDSPERKRMRTEDSMDNTEDHLPVQTLFVYNVPPELSYSTLQEHFRNFGRVQSLQIFWLDGRLGTGSVTFAEKTDAARALLSPVRYLDGCKFNVKASNCCEVTEQLSSPPPSIMTLNDDCLEHKLKNLTLPEQVHFAKRCRRFRGVYLAASARLHKSVEISQLEAMSEWELRDFSQMSGGQVQEMSGVVTYQFVGRFCDFLTSCTNLKKMDIDCDDRNSSYGELFKMLEWLLKLESLKLSHMNFTDQWLGVLQNLRSLKSLNLSDNPLTGIGMHTLPANIEVLTLDHCYNFNARSLKKVLMKLHQLKELNIENIQFPRSSTVYEDIKDHCMSLETLRMSADSKIDYAFVAQLPSLKRLTLHNHFDYSPLPNEFYEQLVEHKAAQLENLEIVGETTVTKEILLNIAKLSELRGLILSRVESDAALPDAFTNLQKLEQFTLLYSDNVSDNPILKLFGDCRKLSYISLPFRELSKKLVQGIVSRVQQETKKEMQRMLPIELRSTEPFKHLTDKFP